MPLNTNWFFTGNIYVSERDGSGDGLSQANPRNDIIATSQTEVVRDGYYSLTSDSYAFGTLLLDGKVVIDGGGSLFGIRGQQNQGLTIRASNRLQPQLINIQNIQPSIISGTGGTSGFLFIDGVRIQGSNKISGGTDSNNREFGRGQSYRFCEFRDCLDIRHEFVFQSSLSSFDVSSRNDYINSSIRVYLNGSIFRSFFNSQSNINTVTTNATYGVEPTRGTLNNCAFEQGFTIGGIDLLTITLNGDSGNIGSLYGDGVKFSGVINTSDGGTLTIVNCFWTATPGKKSSGYLENNSILKNNDVYIGAYDVCITLSASNAAFDPANGAIYSNITRNISPDSFTITSGVSGSVESTKNLAHAINLINIDISQISSVVGSFNYAIGEWIDRANYQSGVNDEVRLTIELDTYNGTSWDGWQDMEIDSVWAKDSLGRGNGNVDVDFTTLENLSDLTFIALRFTIRNDGV